MDYFVFPREIDFNMPPFVVGRPTWDNWLVYKARSIGLPVIDMSDSAYIVHQNHDYSHVQKGSGKSYDGPEAEINKILYKFKGERFGTKDATYRLDEKGLKRALRLKYLRRHFDTITIFKPWAAPLMWPFKAGITVTRPIRMRIRKARGIKSTK